MLSCRDILIEIGPRRLVSGGSFVVDAGIKAGLVGPNGAGKTTLLRTLAGEREPDGGEIHRRGRIGYLSQDPTTAALDVSTTARERILTARAIGSLEREMEEVRAQMEHVSGAQRDRLIRRFSRLEDEFSAGGGYPAKAEAERFAAGLGIGTDELDQPVVTMSGGQRRRVELARILFADTDVLLLDEPTNHLDLDARDWLISFLTGYKGGLLMVSHDLPLLDEAITTIHALDHGTIETYRGDYSHFRVERRRRQERRRKERRRQEADIARLEEGIRRFKGSSEKLAKRARSWETRVQRIRSDLVHVDRPGRAVTVRFPEPEASGRTPLRATSLTKAYGDNIVFVDIDVDLDRGERIAIIGLNGAGKTTLLKILAAQEQPDLGEVVRGHNATIGYYAQEHESIVAGRSVLEHLREVSSLSDRELRGILGHFLLADKIDQDAGTLSGGEKTKLALARLVVGGHNVLMLDEPTNNLDPQATEALLGSLHAYSGTLVLVSHDRDFVAALSPHRAILMPDGETRHFDEDMLGLVELS